MNKKPFQKPPLSHQEQINLLQQRGMRVSNPDIALNALKHINYYRLSAYWLPFEADHTSHQFKTEACFDDVLTLYQFDRHLRLLILDAIERVEVSVRACWSHEMACRHGAHAHLESDLAQNNQRWQSNLEDLTQEVTRSKQTFIQHLSRTYSEPLPPIWAVSEVMSLGLLSKWYDNLKPMQTRDAIASTYGISEQILTSWLRHLNLIRNICAHHARLWNREFVITPKVPKKWPVALSGQFQSSRKLYNTLVILLYWLDMIEEDHHWRQKIRELLLTQASLLQMMDFPSDWEVRSIWAK